MIKKLIMLAMAVAALAAIVPAAANAEGKLTEVGGGLVAEGSEITLTNDPANPLIMQVPNLGTNIVCEEITANVEVTRNNGTDFEGESGATGSTDNCELEGFGPVEFIDPTVLFITGTTTGTGEVELSFISKILGGSVTCDFSSVEPGIFHYPVPPSAGSTVTLTETELFSPACGEAFTSGSVTVENGAGPVVIE